MISVRKKKFAFDLALFSYVDMLIEMFAQFSLVISSVVVDLTIIKISVDQTSMPTINFNYLFILQVKYSHKS